MSAQPVGITLNPLRARSSCGRRVDGGATNSARTSAMRHCQHRRRRDQHRRGDDHRARERPELAPSGASAQRGRPGRAPVGGSARWVTRSSWPRVVQDGRASPGALAGDVPPVGFPTPYPHLRGRGRCGQRAGRRGSARLGPGACPGFAPRPRCRWRARPRRRMSQTNAFASSGGGGGGAPGQPALRWRRSGRKRSGRKRLRRLRRLLR
jgi:hypothetical protein